MASSSKYFLRWYDAYPIFIIEQLYFEVFFEEAYFQQRLFILLHISDGNLLFNILLSCNEKHFFVIFRPALLPALPVVKAGSRSSARASQERTAKRTYRSQLKGQFPQDTAELLGMVSKCIQNRIADQCSMFINLKKKEIQSQDNIRTAPFSQKEIYFRDFRSFSSPVRRGKKRGMESFLCCLCSSSTQLIFFPYIDLCAPCSCKTSRIDRQISKRF